MSFAARAKATADRLITKYGNDVILVEYNIGAYNPTIGKKDKIEIPHPIKGAVTNFTIAQMANDNITASDLLVIVETDMNVTRDWKILIGTKYLQIINIVTITAQNAKIILKIQVRA